KGNTDIEKSISRKRPLSYPYSLKLGAFRTLERTQKAITFYSNKDLCPYWIKVDLKEEGEWYRIFTGHFENYEQAERFRQEHRLTESIVRETPYASLIGIFISLDELENKTLSLKHNGYSPYIIEDPKGIFRLFVGAFFTIDEAAEQCDDMKSHSIQCHIVKR
ncbi:SPOR domain-containing protein, partial [Thermodesulfobacteriota bacterium]